MTAQTANRATALVRLAVPAAYEHVLARLRKAIQLSEFLPGERLPNERDLSDSLGVSRVTVREALRVLQSDGIIATRRGRGGGTVVLPGAAESLARRDSRPVIAQRIRDVLELRLAIEPMAASLAAVRALSDDIAVMQRYQYDLSCSTDIPTFRRADSGFHLAIADASGNALLRQAIEDARSAMFPIVDAHEFSVVHDTSALAHQAILDAIANGDAELAATRMHADIVEASKKISAVLLHQQAEVGQAP